MAGNRLPGYVEEVLGRIASENGHSFAKHVLEQKEFMDPAHGPNIDVKSPEDLHKFLRETLLDPDTLGFAAKDSGAHLYFYNSRNNVIVVIEPKNPDGGSFWRPPDKAEGFNIILNDHSDRLGKTPEIIKGGYPALESFIETTKEALPKVGKLGKLGQFFSENAFKGADFKILLGALLTPATAKAAAAATKLAGPAGVIGAAWEAGDLIEKAQNAVLRGELSPEAFEDYKKVLALHTAQATVDPSLVLLEGKTQELYDHFAACYGLSPELKEELEPASLIEMILGQEIQSAKSAAAPLPASAPSYAYAP